MFVSDFINTSWAKAQFLIGWHDASSSPTFRYLNSENIKPCCDACKTAAPHLSVHRLNTETGHLERANLVNSKEWARITWTAPTAFLHSAQDLEGLNIFKKSLCYANVSSTSPLLTFACLTVPCDLSPTECHRQNVLISSSKGSCGRSFVQLTFTMRFIHCLGDHSLNKGSFFQHALPLDIFECPIFVPGQREAVQTCLSEKIHL